MSILLQQKNVGDYSYMSSPNIYYRAIFYRAISPSFLLSNVVSAEVGVAWEYAATNCFYILHISPFQM